MPKQHNLTVRLLAAMIFLAALRSAVAQPTILSTVPINGATGVLPGASVVFTFSAAMDPTVTSVFFSDVTASFESPTVILVWSAGNTVLTCKPAPSFANNHHIQWNVDGQDAVGNFLTGTTSGSFTTVAGVNGGSGTNSMTSFLVGKYDLYNQTSNSPSTVLTHEFYAQTILASNRTATNITVTIPTTGGISNLVEDLLEPEQFDKVVFSQSATNLSTNFPSGNYIFNVRAVASNQQITVNLPNYAQPNSPQVLNYSAAHTINPAQSFILNWNTFTNGGSADWILVEVNNDDGIALFQTPFLGQPGGLNGLATAVTIPAGTLPANSTNNATLVFYHFTSTTNGGNVTGAFVGSATLFTIATGAASATATGPVLAIVRSGANLLLEWPTNATGYTLQFTTNLAPAAWTTNLPAPVIINTNKVVTNAITGRRFFRLIK